MNLIVGTLWLVAGVSLFAYELYTDKLFFPIRSLNISMGWLLVLLALYNYGRWYQSRSRASSKAVDYVREARVRQAQRRERVEPDPTFDFTRPDPPPTGRPPIDQRPSNN